MKTYLIEREIPDAGKFTGEQLKGISQKSCSVLMELGAGIQWIHSYVTGNKIYCIYKAESEELIREHARKGGFPANKIVEISSVISPAVGRVVHEGLLLGLRAAGGERTLGLLRAGSSAGQIATVMASWLPWRCRPGCRPPSRCRCRQW